MKTTARITTNIDASLLAFVDNEAKKNKLTRREIIERSIGRYRLHDRRMELQKEWDDYAKWLKENPDEFADWYAASLYDTQKI